MAPKAIGHRYARDNTAGENHHNSNYIVDNSGFKQVSLWNSRGDIIVPSSVNPGNSGLEPIRGRERRVLDKVDIDINRLDTIDTIKAAQYLGTPWTYHIGLGLTNVTELVGRKKSPNKEAREGLKR